MESTNLVELVKNMFSKPLINEAATELGEDKNAIEKALNGFIPAVLLRLEAKAHSRHSSDLKALHEDVVKVMEDEDNVPEGIKQNLSRPEAGVDSILNVLFVDRLSRTIKEVSDYAEVKHSSGERLLGATASATIRTLYRHFNDNDEEVKKALIAEKGNTIEQIPSDLNLAHPLGLTNIEEVDQEPVVPLESDTEYQQHHRSHVSVGQWIIIFVLGLSILFGFYAGCGSNEFGVTQKLPKVDNSSQAQAPAATSKSTKDQ